MSEAARDDPDGFWQQWAKELNVMFRMEDVSSEMKKRGCGFISWWGEENRTGDPCSGSNFFRSLATVCPRTCGCFLPDSPPNYRSAAGQWMGTWCPPSCGAV